MDRYIYELPDWPKFRWDQTMLAAPLAAVRHRQGRLIGRMEALGFSLRKEAVLQTLTLDVLKSSEIEGEILNPERGPLLNCAAAGNGCCGISTGRSHR